MLNQSLIIEVKKGEDGRRHLHKPIQEGRWAHHYRIKETGEKEGKKFSVHVHWDKDGPSCPALLYFSSADEAISGVGFAELKKDLVEHSSRGPCGAGFVLLGDLPPPGPNEKKVAVVENWGNMRKQGFHFEIWFNHKKSGFDPQIYNEGEVHPLPEEEGWKGKLFRLLRRLTRRPR